MTTKIPIFNKLLVSTFKTLEVVDISDIIFIKSYENYSRLQLADNINYMSTQAFCRYTEMLEPLNFFKVHKSFLINMNHVKRYHKSGIVELTNDIHITVARRRKDDFINQMHYTLQCGHKNQKMINNEGINYSIHNTILPT